MAIRLSCCLNLPPNPTNNNSFPPKASQLSIWKKSGEERTRNLPGAFAAIVIGVELAAIMISPSSPYSAAVRGEQRAMETASHSQPPRARVAAPPKWSDTIRTCPAWRGNSLESIVPENLPRPSAHPRTETVRLTNGEAPPVKFSVQRVIDGGCFNM